MKRKAVDVIYIIDETYKTRAKILNALNEGYEIEGFAIGDNKLKHILMVKYEEET